MSIIESYSFGRMVIDGTRYTKDVIIYPDGSILSPWWRHRGHMLEPIDFKDLIAMAPVPQMISSGVMVIKSLKSIGSSSCPRWRHQVLRMLPSG